MDVVKNKMQSWLEIRPNSPHAIVIQRDEDLQIYFAKNKLWYIGDENELSELYKQLQSKSQTFWGGVPTAGLEIKKSHSGLPKLIINTITNIVIDNYNGVESESTAEIDKWKDIAKDNKFDKQLWKILSETLYMGDGAIKLSFDEDISEYPIIEWYSGDKVDFIYKRGRLIELVFKTFLEKNNKKYLLKEIYGYGYVKYKLYYDDEEINDLSILEETKGLEDLTFDKSTMWAIPFMIDHNSKYEGRGASKFDGKYTSFDSLDEVISQWIEAVRLGRATKYIPEKLIPRDPKNGELEKPNAFDNQFIMTESDMSENGVSTNNKIQVEQPDIPSDKYLQTYMTYLDLCLQGLISPSTLGIDTKKIQDANAQYERQMEKTTMYTRQGIIEALNEFIPKLINTVLKMQKQLLKEPIGEDIDIDVKFSEYDSPSFDSQIDTISKAKMNGIMSVETSVKELYGDSKDEKWLDEEIKRIKEEQGITEIPEPAINKDLDLFGDDV
jgi:hypothetical protein